MISQNSLVLLLVSVVAVSPWRLSLSVVLTVVDTLFITVCSIFSTRLLDFSLTLVPNITSKTSRLSSNCSSTSPTLAMTPTPISIVNLSLIFITRINLDVFTYPSLVFVLDDGKAEEILAEGEDTKYQDDVEQ